MTILSNQAHAQDFDPDWAHSDLPVNLTDENDKSILCGSADAAHFALILRYSESVAEISLVGALDVTRCTLARGTSQEYVGNMLHIAIRNNPNKQDITLQISNGLLRNGRGNPELRALFVDLVLGNGADIGIFPQLQDSWDTERSSRGLIENSARIICLSIDRYDHYGA